MESMTERAAGKIQRGMDVCDVLGKKIGSVAHLQEGSRLVGGMPVGGYVEVKTGFFLFGKHLYVPLDEVREVTEGGVILSRPKAEIETMDWRTPPEEAEGVQPDGGTAGVPAESPAQGEATPEPDSESWDSASGHYRARWQQRYGTLGGRWESYEPRYRFAWEMSELDRLQGQSWAEAQAELRRAWEARYPYEEWEQVAETVRDAWEHPAGAAGGAGVTGRAA